MRHRLTRASPFAAQQLYALVADVERYPEFIPWITSLVVSNRRENADGSALIDADAGVRFSIIRERFATRVTLAPAALAIDVDLISGPFRRLSNQWRFTSRRGGSELSFQIDFEFKSRLLDRIFSANSEKAARRLVRCFETRAKQLYG